MSPHYQKRKLTLRKNQLVGKFGEDTAKAEYIAEGWQVFPASIGYDFLAVKKLQDGSIAEQYVEVKSRDAKISKLQERKMRECRKRGLIYRVFRINGDYIKNNFPPLYPDNHVDIEDGTIRIPNTTSCPNCKKKSSGIENILKHFGWRRIGNKIFVQSWCRQCRFPFGRITS